MSMLLANAGRMLGNPSNLMRPISNLSRPRAARAMSSTRADLVKTDLVSIVAQKTGLNKDQSKGAVDAVLDSILNAVAKGEKVSIVGFGNFERAIRAARTGRNPATGESLEIPEKATPTFKPGKVFKDTVKAAYTP